MDKTGPLKQARFEMRIDPELKALLETAARITGRDVSDWARGVLAREARRTVSDAEATA